MFGGFSCTVLIIRYSSARLLSSNTSCRVSSRGSPIVFIWITSSLNWSTCTANCVPDSVLKLNNFLVTTSRFLSVFRLNCSSSMRHESAAVVAPRM
uniref:Secreted protein n=1 Tax=Phytophthora fragariae TaxID=53985 RepID=A0A6A3E4X7_9STRA|nr:hypothetical protein PF009_g22533 [Phytophthora fragariae]